MSSPQTQIADKLKSAIEKVTTTNGYSKTIKTVAFDRVRLNISDYNDYELPAVQIIDLSCNINHQQSRSLTDWYVALEVCMRSTENGLVDQKALWDLQTDIVRAIMIDPKLGLNFITHVFIIDKTTDLHLQEPNYIGTIGIEIQYYEPITRNDC